MVLLAVILIGVAAATWGAIAKIDYQWRWFRVPQYFFYLAEEPQKIPFDGRVTTVTEEGKSIRVALLGEKGEKHELQVDSGNLRVNEGDELFSGDTIGFSKSWRLGPLMYGLWTTLWLSAVSSFFCPDPRADHRSGPDFEKSDPARPGGDLRRVHPRHPSAGADLHRLLFPRHGFQPQPQRLRHRRSLPLCRGLCRRDRPGRGPVDRQGQTEAARSLGMNAFQTMWDIVLPQAFKRILPPLSGQFISLIKDSSLVSVIAITDLTKAGREIITSTFATFEVWLVVAAMYLLVTSLLSQMVYYMERRFSISD
jgi:polar amino acid transport system permease protein